MPPKERVPQARNWVFTIHGDKDDAHPLGWTAEEWYEALKSAPWEEENVRYCVYQLERGETGRHHLQGFLSFTRQVRRPQVLRVLRDPPVHFVQVAVGSPSQNKNYCTKAEGQLAAPVEWGNCPGGQGTRSDLEAFTDVIKVSGLKRATEELPTVFIKYARGARELDSFYRGLQLPDLREVWVCVLWGDSGGGKSWAANAFAPDVPRFRVQEAAQNQTQWFDNYAGEEILILDDFCGTLNFRSLLRILDGYKEQYQTKGGHVWGSWKYVLITSNTNPNQWYDDRDRRGGELDYWRDPAFPDFRPSPLQRRINLTYHVTGVFPAQEWSPVVPDWLPAPAPRPPASAAGAPPPPPPPFLTPAPIDTRLPGEF